tara:strand:- start:287 stop:1531 length:1245 start_codon:yes stop_codon:yes gene_type:complete
MNINFKENKSYIEEVCLEELLKLYETPFYVYSQQRIIDSFNILSKNLSAEIFYSVKANSNQAILKIIKNCGAGADVVSRGELQRSLEAGFNPNKIIFEGVGKSKNDIEYAIKKNIRLINIESINELKLINEIGEGENTKIDVGIRFNPNIDSQQIDKISTGKNTDKFGIGFDKANELISLFKNLNHINFKGISCHIGSQIKDISIFEKVFISMKNIAEIILSNGIKIEYIDLGGGFAVNYEKEEDDLDIQSIENLIKSIFKKTPCKISFEPGRYLVAKSGIIVTKILTLKENGGVNFLITDAGMQTIIRPAIYNTSHRIESLNSLNSEKTKYTIAGPICESSDILIKDIILPEQVVGNHLVIHDAGAYGFVMSSNYNTRGFPSEILIYKNKFDLIHKKNDISQIINQDLIPGWL